MDYTFRFDVVWNALDVIVEGALRTVELATASLVCGFILGVAGAYLVGSPRRAVARTAFIIGDIVRNTPLLVQLFLLFFGLASLGLRLSPFGAAFLALTIHSAAYLMEVVRAGIQSVPRGQTEAGHALGLPPGQVFVKIVLPQALDKVYPALTSQCVLLMLASSLASTISAPELTLVANDIISRTFRSFEVYIGLAFIYLALVVVFRLAFFAIGVAAFPRRRLDLRTAFGTLRRRRRGRTTAPVRVGWSV